MSTHLRRKKGRDRRQNRVYEENHRKIRILLEKSRDGLKRKEIQKGAGIGSRRILRRHLSDFGSEIVYRDRKLLWHHQHERVTVVNELLVSMLSAIEEKEFHYNGSEGIDKYLMDKVLMFIPKQVGDELRYSLCEIPIHDMKKNAQKVWNRAEKVIQELDEKQS